MTHIDTAEMYGDAELVIADAIAGRRDEVFLVSKVLPSNASRRGTITACERSLKRLKTDRLDCYLLHWRGSYPLEDTGAAFEELVKAGKIKSWGVSNFDADDLEEMLDVAGEGRIACNQVLYHLKERAIEHAVIPWCERHGVAVVAYSPFGHDDFPASNSKGGAVLARIAEARRVTPASDRAELPHPCDYGVRDPEGVVGGTCRRKCRCRRSRADERGDCCTGCGVSARSEAPRSAHAVVQQARILNGVLTRAALSAYRHPVFGSCERGAFVVFYERSIRIFPEFQP
ncbi:hypothetical protein BRDID11002_06060 [Bradyrhizobium diazoefficiens]